MSDTAELDHVDLQNGDDGRVPEPPSRSVSQVMNHDAGSEVVVSDEASEVLPQRPSVGVPSDEDFLTFRDCAEKFLQKVIRNVTSRKYKPLRDQCREAVGVLEKGTESAWQSVPAIMRVIKACFESGKTVAVDVAMECLHKILEFGFIAAAPGPHHPISECIDLTFETNTTDEIVDMVCACIETADEGIYLRIVQVLLSLMKCTATGLHHGSLLASVRTTYNIFLNAKSGGVRPTARASLTQIVSLIFTKMETESVELKARVQGALEEGGALEGQKVAVEKNQEMNDDEMSEYFSVIQKDAYLLFRALCKLSSKDLPEGSGPETTAHRSKVLSLELVGLALQESGHVFRTEERFIYLLRQYLVPTLLTNCMCSSMVVVDMALDIFEMLVLRQSIRPILKEEIASVFGTVIFRFLESPASGFPRRRRALRVLNNICRDPQCLADLFVNYDCDKDSSNIFEKIVTVLTAASQSATGFMDQKYENELRRAALQGIATVIHSLRIWGAEEHYAATAYGGGGEVPIERHDEASLVREGAPAPLGPPSTGQEISGATLSEATESDTARFQETLRHKRLVDQGVSKFNLKPKHGIAFLIEQKIIHGDPVNIAEFLRNSDGVDATLLGEYLGEADELNVRVMHAFTDQQDFTGMNFDEAIREYLSGFRLPGEAQKIDRIMEKFASRFCQCNPDLFANADTAYVLAYSTIMLNTDAHNPMVRNKMSKEEFTRNNRGINDGQDLDPQFLGNLYDRIVHSQIQIGGGMKDSKMDSALARATEGTSTGVNLFDASQRAETFRKESEKLLAQTKLLFAQRKQTTQDYVYYSATSNHHAMLLFESSWAAILAAISLALERAPPTDEEMVPLCLEPFRDGIALASSFGMDTEKESFLSSLAKFTHLESVSAMRAKNVACVRAMLDIATFEGNHLGKDWTTIVRGVSQLETIRAVARGHPDQYSLAQQSTPEINLERHTNDLASFGGSMRFLGSYQPVQDAKASQSFSDPDLSRPILPTEIDGSAIAVARAIDGSEIDRLFLNSAKLATNGITDLAQALCTVALEELNEKPVSRVFCLQKIIEISYFNMDARTRMQWSKIWEIFSPFFATAMSHPSSQVAMYCIDSLRQLASKFLDKDELANYAFQKTFLKPFEVGFSRAKSVAVRELILSCISQLVLSRASNIKSGWKPLFVVLSMAAEDRSEAIMNFGFQIVDTVLRKYFSKIDDVFIDAVSGVAAYARNPLSSAVCLAAIDHLSVRAAHLLAEGNAFAGAKPVPSKQGDGALKFSDQVDAHIAAWFPLLTGLANAVGDTRENVRSSASDGLFSVLKIYGGMFDRGMWELIFRGVLSPLFDDVEHLPGGDRHGAVTAPEDKSSEWATTTGSAALQKLVDVFVDHFEITRFLLPDLLGLIRSWIVQEAEQIAREGMEAMKRMFGVFASLLTSDEWEIVVSSLSDLISGTLPHEITDREALNPKGSESKGDNMGAGLENGSSSTPTGKPSEDLSKRVPPRPGIDFKVVRTKCVVQLLLIQAIDELVSKSYVLLSTSQLIRLADALEQTYQFARRFNLNVELRFALWKAGFMNQVPNLFKQETTGMTGFLRLLFLLFVDEYKDPTSASMVETRLFEVCERTMKTFLASSCELRDKPEEQRELLAQVPVICFILNYFLQLAEDQFQQHLPTFFDLLMELIEVDFRDVRMSVADLIRFRFPSKIPSLGRPYYPEVEFPSSIKVLTLSVEGMKGAREVQSKLLEIKGVYRVKVEDRNGIVRVYGAPRVEEVLSVLASSRLGRKVVILAPNGQPMDVDQVKLSDEDPPSSATKPASAPSSDTVADLSREVKDDAAALAVPK